MEIEEKFMRRCIQLARCGILGAPPNPLVGAVIVHKGKIVGEGYHRRCGGPHAEVNAVRSVQNPQCLEDSTLYVSLEPCSHYGKTPPCCDLIIEKKIPRVVIGCQDTFGKVNGNGIRRLREAGVEVEVGLLEKECRNLNERFFTYHTLHRPWIMLKWAQSEDGFIAGKMGNPVQFSTPLTQALMHKERSQCDAILVGTRTVQKDNPTLDVRHWFGKSPLRITIDRKGVLPEDLHMKNEVAPWHIYEDGDLDGILRDLYERGVQSLMVEGGRELLQSFLKKDLWDEIRVEKSHTCLCEGVPAPCVEKEIELYSTCTLDGNDIRVYRRKV